MPAFKRGLTVATLAATLAGCSGWPFGGGEGGFEVPKTSDAPAAFAVGRAACEFVTLPHSEDESDEQKQKVQFARQNVIIERLAYVATEQTRQVWPDRSWLHVGDAVFEVTSVDEPIPVTRLQSAEQYWPNDFQGPLEMAAGMQAFITAGACS